MLDYIILLIIFKHKFKLYTHMLFKNGNLNVMLSFKFQNFNYFLILPHSSEIRGLCSTKCSSETLQNLLYFMYKKTHVVFFVFHFMQLYIFTLWMPWSLSKNIKLHEIKTKKTTWVLLLQKYGKFWSVSLEHFVEHKPLISEEWLTININL